jgi:hypothetical protein
MMLANGDFLTNLGTPRKLKMVSVYRANMRLASAIRMLRLIHGLVFSKCLISLGGVDAPTGGPTNNEFPPGITIRAGPRPTNSFKCASALQTALADIFSLNAALHVDQVTPSLSACKYECVEIDVGN